MTDHTPLADWPKLLIFDCDGVLVDSQALQCRIDAELLTQLGFPITAEDMARRYIGVTTEDILAELEAAAGRRAPENFEAIRDRAVDAAYRRELKAVGSARATIAALGASVCVASNAATHRVRFALETTGLDGLFGERVFGADLVARPKPAPELFLYCAASMGVAPADCLVIEDSVVGVKAAVAANMPVLGFHGGAHCYPGYERQLLSAGCQDVFARFPDLFETVARLCEGQERALVRGGQ